MQLPAALEVGVASHTGRVRAANEDDYLVVAQKDPATGALFVVADGMGTTLTTLHLDGAEAVIGHVGDTRCLRLRDGRLQQLTTDHALRGETSHLTRCIGGGRPTETPDLLAADARPGDVFLLASDGLWSVVPPELITARLRQLAPQAAADALIEAANAAGGPDNATAIVVRIGDGSAGGRVAADLPRAEARSLLPALRGGSLRRPRWPWLLLALAVLLAGATVARLVAGIDVVAWLRAMFRGG